MFSSLTNVPNLIDADVDNNVLSQGDFNYYYSVNDFSVIHSNVRSLAANHDKLTIMLSNLGHNFHVIGLTETRIMNGNDPVVNTDIPCYKFISQPSLHHAGGAGFHVRSNCDFHIRDDLNSTTG